MHQLTELIQNDMKPALGVTEPGAIAFAVARARAEVPGEIQSVEVRLNSGMYKNAYTCGIPHSNEVGNVFSAALGVVAGDANLELESLSKVTEADNIEAKKLVEAGKIVVLLDHMGSEIDIWAQVITSAGRCVVHIAKSHTNIISIEKDGKTIFKANQESNPEIVPDKTEQEKPDRCHKKDIPIIHRYSLREIFEYISQVPISEIEFIKEAYRVNMALFKAGLASSKTTFVHTLFEMNEEQVFSDNIKQTAQLLCVGAIEARVLGLSNPAMSITGSGAHGIIATLPLYAYASEGVNGQEELKVSQSLLRATALSYLITMYIKEYSGKLSAFCGCGIAAGTGMASGLAYLQGASVEKITQVIWNMSSGLTGMICDGGNQGCIMKGIVATDAAYRAAELAMKNTYIRPEHGINGDTPEQTMKHMGMIASPGMVETEKTIVEIMKGK